MSRVTGLAVESETPPVGASTRRRLELAGGRKVTNKFFNEIGIIKRLAIRTNVPTHRPRLSQMQKHSILQIAPEANLSTFELRKKNQAEQQVSLADRAHSRKQRANAARQIPRLSDLILHQLPGRGGVL